MVRFAVALAVLVGFAAGIAPPPDTTCADLSGHASCLDCTSFEVQGGGRCLWNPADGKCHSEATAPEGSINACPCGPDGVTCPCGQTCEGGTCIESASDCSGWCEDDLGTRHDGVCESFINEDVQPPAEECRCSASSPPTTTPTATTAPADPCADVNCGCGFVCNPQLTGPDLCEEFFPSETDSCPGACDSPDKSCSVLHTEVGLRCQCQGSATPTCEGVSCPCGTRCEVINGDVGCVEFEAASANDCFDSPCELENHFCHFFEETREGITRGLCGCRTRCDLRDCPCGTVCELDATGADSCVPYTAAPGDNECPGSCTDADGVVVGQCTFLDASNECACTTTPAAATTTAVNPPSTTQYDPCADFGECACGTRCDSDSEGFAFCADIVSPTAEDCTGACRSSSSGQLFGKCALIGADCGCVDPCRDHGCECGKVCEVNPDTGDAHCIAYTPPSLSSNCPGECLTDDLNSHCLVTASNAGSELSCTCRDPCQDITCDCGGECRQTGDNRFECVYDYFPEPGAAAQCPGSCANAAAGDGHICEWQWNDGDRTTGECKCHDPCADKDCPCGSSCTVVEGEPICKEIPQDQLTSRSCDGTCPFRTSQCVLSEDEYGVRFCDCFDPCKGVTCGCGEQCVADPDSATGSSCAAIPASNLSEENCHGLCDGENRSCQLRSSFGVLECKCFDQECTKECACGEKCVFDGPEMVCKPLTDAEAGPDACNGWCEGPAGSLVHCVYTQNPLGAGGNCECQDPCGAFDCPCGEQCSKLEDGTYGCAAIPNGQATAEMCESSRCEDQTKRCQFYQVNLGAQTVTGCDCAEPDPCADHPCDCGFQCEVDGTDPFCVPIPASQLSADTCGAGHCPEGLPCHFKPALNDVDEPKCFCEEPETTPTANCKTYWQCTDDSGATTTSDTRLAGAVCEPVCEPLHDCPRLTNGATAWERTCQPDPEWPFIDSNEVCDCWVPPCVELDGYDFGECDTVLGWGVHGGVCEAIVGCESVFHGLNVMLAGSEEECRDQCDPCANVECACGQVCDGVAGGEPTCVPWQGPATGDDEPRHCPGSCGNDGWCQFIRFDTAPSQSFECKCSPIETTPVDPCADVDCECGKVCEEGNCVEYTPTPGTVPFCPAGRCPNDIDECRYSSSDQRCACSAPSTTAEPPQCITRWRCAAEGGTVEDLDQPVAGRDCWPVCATEHCPLYVEPDLSYEWNQECLVRDFVNPSDAECKCAVGPCEEVGAHNFGECDFPLGWGIVSGACVEISGCDAGPFTLLSSEAACKERCDPRPTCNDIECDCGLVCVDTDNGPQCLAPPGFGGELCDGACPSGKRCIRDPEHSDQTPRGCLCAQEDPCANRVCDCGLECVVNDNGGAECVNVDTSGLNPGYPCPGACDVANTRCVFATADEGCVCSDGGSATTTPAPCDLLCECGSECVVTSSGGQVCQPVIVSGLENGSPCPGACEADNVRCVFVKELQECLCSDGGEVTTTAEPSGTPEPTDPCENHHCECGSSCSVDADGNVLCVDVDFSDFADGSSCPGSCATPGAADSDNTRRCVYVADQHECDCVDDEPQTTTAPPDPCEGVTCSCGRECRVQDDGTAACEPVDTNNMHHGDSCPGSCDNGTQGTLQRCLYNDLSDACLCVEPDATSTSEGHPATTTPEPTADPCADRACPCGQVCTVDDEYNTVRCVDVALNDFENGDVCPGNCLSFGAPDNRPCLYNAEKGACECESDDDTTTAPPDPCDQLDCHCGRHCVVTDNGPVCQPFTDFGSLQDGDECPGRCTNAQTSCRFRQQQQFCTCVGDQTDPTDPTDPADTTTPRPTPAPCQLVTVETETGGTETTCRGHCRNALSASFQNQYRCDKARDGDCECKPVKDTCDRYSAIGFSENPLSQTHRVPGTLSPVPFCRGNCDASGTRCKFVQGENDCTCDDRGCDDKEPAVIKIAICADLEQVRLRYLPNFILPSALSDFIGLHDQDDATVREILTKFGKLLCHTLFHQFEKWIDILDLDFLVCPANFLALPDDVESTVFENCDGRTYVLRLAFSPCDREDQFEKEQLIRVLEFLQNPVVEANGIDKRIGELFGISDAEVLDTEGDWPTGLFDGAESNRRRAVLAAAGVAAVAGAVNLA